MKVIKTVATPNPNALKFLFDQVIVWNGSRSFLSFEEAKENLAVQELFQIPQVTSVFMMKDMVTVNKTSELSWDQLITIIVDTLEEHLKVDYEEVAKKVVNSENSDKLQDMQKMNDILDEKVRPGLAGDGGGIEILDYIDGVVSVHYEGACGTCPSASEGTLQYIEQTLRTDFDPGIVVVAT